MPHRSDALHSILSSLHREAPAVRGSAVLTLDGLVVAAYPPGWEGDIHDPTGGEHVAAMAAVVASMAEQTLRRLAQGDLERVLMEGAHGTLGVFPATHDAALAVLVDKDARLGLVAQAARRAAVQVRALLDQPA